MLWHNRKQVQHISWDVIDISRCCRLCLHSHIYILYSQHINSTNWLIHFTSNVSFTTNATQIVNYSGYIYIHIFFRWFPFCVCWCDLSTVDQWCSCIACIQFYAFVFGFLTFYQYHAFPQIEPMIFELLVSCSTLWAIGRLGCENKETSTAKFLQFVWSKHALFTL